MLSFILSCGSMMVVREMWGEFLVMMMLLTGIFLMNSSDNLMWKISFLGEMDYISWSLTGLSFWVVMLSVLGSVMVKKNLLRYMFLMFNMALLISFLVSFYVSDFMFFYLGFESCLVPIFFLILGWGYQPERIEAGVYMLMYTVFGSLPLFFLILWMKKSGSSYMYWQMFMSGSSFFFYVFLMGAFLVKFPMYGVHLWLLKAHVEAPVAGSMLLAGVMLKLGGYGMIRFLPFWESSPEKVKDVIMILSLWGGFMVSLTCLRQMDMKLLIASSSVVHMSMCIGGLLVMSEWGMKGSVFLMVGHGLCSSGLFFLANIVYLRTGSRSMTVSKGFLNVMPSMSLVWFLLVVCNMGSPPSLNLLGEILIISTLVNWSYLSVILIAFLSFFGACYSIYLFSLSQHGKYVKVISGSDSGKSLEYLICMGHWLPLNMIILSIFCLG
uniref:NADH-ubiquinone oxidoreductase chain 4 n=1 Tax=Pandorites podoceroides TaxID=1842081 RepID=A0A9N6YK46_9CRUS|nr:TPA_asm: ND4 [Pandorites podoceroides]